MCVSGSSTRDSVPALTDHVCSFAAVCRPLPVTFHRGEFAGTAALGRIQSVCVPLLAEGGAGRELDLLWLFFGEEKLCRLCYSPQEKRSRGLRFGSCLIAL